MSLLNRSTDLVTVYPEVVVADIDGNQRTKASAVGTIAKAVVQTVTSSEQASDGSVVVTEKLRLRLVGWNGAELGSQAQVEWQGRRYSVDGEPRRFHGSSRTAHIDYHLVRS